MKHLIRLVSIAVAVALVSAIGATIAASSAPGSTSLPTTAPRQTPADLASALGADGTFHGAPGMEGAVDTSAWNLVSDPAAGGPPRFAPAADAVLASSVGPWSALGSDGSGAGALNGPVYTMAFSGTDLYVGGSSRTSRAWRAPT